MILVSMTAYPERSRSQKKLQAFRKGRHNKFILQKIYESKLKKFKASLDIRHQSPDNHLPDYRSYRLVSVNLIIRIICMLSIALLLLKRTP